MPVPGREELEFVPLPAPSAEEVAALTERVARRITKRVRKLVEEEEAEGTRLEETMLSLESSLLLAMRVPVPDARFLFGDGDHESESTGPEATGVKRPRLCAKVAGFSLHAGRFVHAADRDGLERLCRYGLRAPFSQGLENLVEPTRVCPLLQAEMPRPGQSLEEADESSCVRFENLGLEPPATRADHGCGAASRMRVQADTPVHGRSPLGK